MAKMLTIGERDMENTNFLKKYGLETYNLLFPDYPSGIDPIIPIGTKWKNQPEQFIAPEDKSVYLPYLTEIYEKPPIGLGSNNWAISAEKSNLPRSIL